MKLSVKRVYEPASALDGTRVLVDRLWPRGLSKTAAKVDWWLKEVAPSAALRQWFGHEPGKWAEFQPRYRAELAHNPALAELKARAAHETLTLLYAARDEAHNHALVLQSLLNDR